MREVLTSGSADLLPQADLQRFLENVGDGPAPLLFPVLSLEQQKVGVNPSYDGFFGPVVGDLTANADDDDDSSDNNDEVAEDPFTSNAKYLIPKKASLKALLDNDPRVLASSIEDGRINDIYFTSNNNINNSCTDATAVNCSPLFLHLCSNCRCDFRPRCFPYRRSWICLP